MSNQSTNTSLMYTCTTSITKTITVTEALYVRWKSSKGIRYWTTKETLHLLKKQ